MISAEYILAMKILPGPIDDYHTDLTKTIEEVDKKMPSQEHISTSLQLALFQKQKQ
jgi:hypothetical protein